MSGPYKLVSLPPTVKPFLLKRRQLQEWVRHGLTEVVHQFPENLSIEADIINLRQEIEPLLEPLCAQPLLDWLVEDILFCARWVSSFTGSRDMRVRLEKLDDRACPKFHVDSVTVRLLCTYCGPGTEWTDANTAYSINFEEDYDEASVYHIPSESIVMYGGSKTIYGMTPLWHRSPDVAVGTQRLLLCIDPVKDA